jgi:hypothetical protein
MVDGHLERDRCRFFDFASNFGLWPTFSGCGAMMSVSLSDLFFLFLRPSSCLDAIVYGLDRGSPMSASPFDYLFHTITSYLLLFFETARSDNVHGRCSLVGP